MTKRSLPFVADDVPFPRGTRVVLRRAAVDESGREHRAGGLAVVRDSTKSDAGTRVMIETPSGAVLHVDRTALQLQKEDLLADLASRAWDYRRLRGECVIYAAVVGSQAWGLANEQSDEDVRGCFLLPFDDHVSLYDAPEEIHDDERQEAYWELEKLVRQALRADPNTLETLWSPLHKVMTPLGKRLVDERALFSSQHVVGSFGRYAASQLQKLERAAQRAAHTRALLDDVAAGRVADEAQAKRTLPADGEWDVHALVRSLFDRGLLKACSFAALVEAVAAVGVERLAPDEVRPKNAYNLVRLLHSCLRWLSTGEPLIKVDGAVRDELLGIKEERTPLDATLGRAAELARAVEEAAKRPTPLPERPNVDGADALVRDFRRHAARAALSMAPSTSTIPGPPAREHLLAARWLPVPLPADVDVDALKRWLALKLAARPVHNAVVVVGLTGAHAYGFPSPDSDLDLKAIHAAPASTFLGLAGPPNPLETVEVFEGREMDLSSHELGMAAALLLKGNGNMLERLLGPLPVVVSAAGERLARIAQATLSKRVVHHYRGFLHAMRRESDIEARPDSPQGGKRTAKRLLYGYRVACTGAHLLLENALVTDVRTLAPLYGFAPQVGVLIERKQSGELSTLDEHEAAPYLDDFAKLEALLDDALKRSPLPSEPAQAGVDELDALLIEARLALMRRD